MGPAHRGYRSSYEPDLKILTRREPLGVVGCITPFNFPLALTCYKIAIGTRGGFRAGDRRAFGEARRFTTPG